MSGPVNEKHATFAALWIVGGILGIGIFWWATPCMVVVGIVVFAVWLIGEMNLGSDENSGGEKRGGKLP